MVEGRGKKKGLLERLNEGPVICAEGYVFELERRGYVQAGAYVPEVVIDHPHAVKELHREFLHAGSDVIEALTYYAHREKLKIVGRENDIEEINRTAIRLAKEVADEGDALAAGNICNTNIYNPSDPTSFTEVRRLMEEQVAWAVDEGVDFIIAETIAFMGEALIALDVIKKAGAQAVVTLAIHKNGGMRDGYSAEDACRKLKDEGADVVGLNCIRGPDTIMPMLKKIAEKVPGPLAALPVPYRTTDDQPTFESLREEELTPGIPHKTCFPSALEPFTCNRYEMAEFGTQALEMGYRYLGICCGAGPHHIRAMAEALGKSAHSSKYSPDMSKHYSLGNNKMLKSHNTDFSDEL